jgi:hypothetical protein
MSLLGSVSSPVSTAISIWWILLFILLFIFALGFRKSFSINDPKIRIASLLIIIYGLGEGLGSAVFPISHSGNGFNLITNLHILAGSIGTAAILLLPLVLMNIFTDPDHPYFNKFSLMVFFTGALFVSLMILKPFLDKTTSPVESYQGLWQRLYVLDVYIFLIVIAFRMRKYAVRKAEYNPEA